MGEEPPQSWRKRFEEAAGAYGTPFGPSGSDPATLDQLIEGYPAEPLGHEVYGDAMDDLHRGFLNLYTRYKLSFLSTEVEHARKACGSPIEIAMLYSLTLVGMEYADSVVFRNEFALGGDAEPLSEIEIAPQTQLGDYRVDFLVTYRQVGSTSTTDQPEPLRSRPQLSSKQLVVECDGHDWHDRSKEQATRDRERDRSLQRMGIGVFRFTGSDIWNRPFTCAREVVEEISSHTREK